MNTQHVEGKPFRCEICNLYFLQKDILMRHMSSHKYFCDECDKSFPKENHLVIHKKISQDARGEDILL